MAAGYSHTTRSTGTTLTANIYNNSHQNHIDQTPATYDDFSSTVAQMKSTADPGEVGTESQATALSGELERIRFVIKEITGMDQWYETPKLRGINTTGLVGINETVNTKMAIGLTINQADKDDAIFAAKSSDVTHSFTGIEEEDTFGTLSKAAGATGGVQLRGFSANGTNGTGLSLQGHIPDGGVDDTDTTGSVGIILVDAYVDDDSTGREGLSVAAITGNLFVVRDGLLAQLVLKENGELHLGTGGGSPVDMDDWDDVALTRTLMQVQNPEKKGIIDSEWDKFITYNEQSLIDAGILGQYEKGVNRPLICMTQLARLHNGAIWQLGKKMMAMEQKLLALEVR